MTTIPEQQEEEVAGELVTAPAQAIEPAKPVGQVAAQAAAVAATTFVAGAGLAAVVRGRKQRKLARRFGKRRKDLPIVASRSFLIDVHLLDR
jgi:K+-transporting ATPase c subunit